jgi:hypothetical protein
MQQAEILDRYRHLRAISTRHHSAVLDCLARPAILERAKYLGLAYGQALVAESEEEMALIFDLAVHTAKPGRPRAIDRYAKLRRFCPAPKRHACWMRYVGRDSRSGVSNSATKPLA